ncbi:MAG: tetratricopeptide repeat protein [Spirochaetota bacterium]
MQLPESRYQFSARTEKRNGPWKPLLLVAVLIALIAGTVYFFFIRETTNTSASEDNGSSNQAAEGETLSLQELWDQREFTKVNQMCEEKLIEDPLNPQYLALNGFAYFYRGTSLYTLEDQIPQYDQAVVNLRKVLTLPSVPMQGQVHYVLGKTYYHKGRFYIDLAIEHLEKSLEFGYQGSDTNRYLGLAYSELGEHESGVEYFLKATESNPDPVLYMTIGQSYYKLKKIDKALDFLMRAVHSTEDKAIEQKSRFLLGSIYIEENELSKAEDQYKKILSLNSESADAHYYLGEIYAKMDDQVKARAEWRKVLNIDPSHYGALLKLY